MITVTFLIFTNNSIFIIILFFFILYFKSYLMFINTNKIQFIFSSKNLTIFQFLKNLIYLAYTDTLNLIFHFDIKHNHI